MPDKTPKKKQMPTERVRCLGPGDEHWFQSRDKVNNRRCPSCDEKLKSVGGIRTYSDGPPEGRP